MTTHKGISDYLRYISETYQLHICIKDYVGFLHADRKLFMMLQPFLIHKNPYCMEIKSNRQLWDRCILSSNKIHAKAQKLQAPFYGMCYCGVEEYVIPILKDNFVIGVILAGEYSCNNPLSEYRIKKISTQYNMDYEILKEKFYLSVGSEKDSRDKILDLLGIVSNYFSLVYSTLTPSIPLSENSDKNKYFSKDYILSHALEYINKNLYQDITVKNIARFCHCSESYISRIFKKNININIKAYINKLRIEKSKYYLTNYDINVYEVAAKVGYNDPNYFSLVFKNYCGIAPTEYKKRNSPSK